jgi:hypothetical protein
MTNAKFPSAPIHVQKVWKRLFCLFAASAVFITATSQQSPSSPPPAPEAGRVAVTLTVTVTDHDYHPVTGLKTEDFVLYDNGQPQPISSASSGVPGKPNQ